MSVSPGNAHFQLSWDRARRLARIRRTATPFLSVEELVQSHDEIARALRRLSPARLLIDLRDAAPAGRHDAAFEHGGREARKRLVRGFEPVAFLMRTSAGRLQVQRLLREDDIDGRAFLDESEALAWLDSL